jgi:hypothetical protein
MLLAPRVAHYALWAPDGRGLCYVVPDGRALSLRTWRPGEAAARVHLSAAPVFSAWVPNTDWLVCHHGTTLSAFETITGEQRVLSSSAAGFRTPAVQPDGAILWAEVEAGGVVLRRGHLGPPSVATTLAAFAGGVALMPRPQTSEIVLAVAEQPEAGVFSSVLRLDPDGAVQQQLVKGPLVAAWWAPDGSRLATLHPSYTGDGRFQVRFHLADGRPLGTAEPVIPSADTATAVTFFDQYAVSHPCWSADSRWFGLCGRLLRDGPHPSFQGRPLDRALLWDTRSSCALVELSDAVFLSFSREEVNGG